MAWTNQNPLSIDTLRRTVPSAFASDKHDSRSDRYTYIPTSNVIEGLYSAGFLPFQAKQGSSRVAGKAAFTKHMIHFRYRDQIGTRVGGDSTPEIVLINSHDGTSAYKVLAGIFRFVCTNGLIVAESTIGSISIQHKGNIVDNVIDASLKIIDQTPKAVDQIETWRNLQLTNGEQRIFAEAAHELRFERDENGNSTTPIQPAQLLAPRRQDDVGSSLWLTLNRVQEHTVRGGDTALEARRPGLRRRPRRVTSRAVNGIDGDVRLNRSLWSLAEKMAELKGAA